MFSPHSARSTSTSLCESSVQSVPDAIKAARYVISAETLPNLCFNAFTDRHCSVDFHHLLCDVEHFSADSDHFSDLVDLGMIMASLNVSYSLS